MPLFSRSRRTHHTTSAARRPGFFSRSRRGGGLFHRADRDRVAGGYKAALSNPHSTHRGRKHAKRELRLMGRGNETHVPLMTKIKRTLGIRSTRRRDRRTAVL